MDLANSSKFKISTRERSLMVVSGVAFYELQFSSEETQQWLLHMGQLLGKWQKLILVILFVPMPFRVGYHLAKGSRASIPLV